MENLFNTISGFLNNHVALLLFLCLGLGYIVGRIKIGKIAIGATVGTLVICIVLSKIAGIQIQEEIQVVLKTTFFSLFCFTVGFDVGPSFFASMRSSGIKMLLLSVFFAVAALFTAYGVCKAAGLDLGYSLGLLAGAITQSAITGTANLSGDFGSHATTAFGLTYIFGTIGVVVFIKNVAPLILKKSLPEIVKNKIDSISASGTAKSENTTESILQLRAYTVTSDSQYIGKTTSQLEELFDSLEIEALYRGNDIIYDVNGITLLAGDVIQVLGNIESLNCADECGLTEVSDSKYFKVCVTDAKIVLTADFSANGKELLSNYGIVLKRETPDNSFRKGSILYVRGSVNAIKKAAKIMGYIKEEGNITDISFMALAIVAGMLIGTLTIKIGSLPFSLGESVGALVVGLICGWRYNKKPRFGHIPEATRLFLKGLGLNVFIAVLALDAGVQFFDAFKVNGLKIILLGAVVTLVPHIVSLLFGKYVLKLDDAELLGGLCGCGTCTAALNGLTEETGSSVFAIGYAPGYAAGNVLLTIIGLILSFVI